MAMVETVTAKFLYPKSNPQRRMFALLYFSSLLTIWTVLGHTVLGWEQAWSAVVASLLTGVVVTLVLEVARARSNGQTPLFLRGFTSTISLLLPALIPSLAVPMLVYPNDRLWPLVFATTLSIGSKAIFRAPLPGTGTTQHIFNPSNLGIATTLTFFPAVGLAPPYHLVENVTGWAHWLLPMGLLASGILVHGLFTGRLPLCLAWIVGFILQGQIRSLVFGIPWIVPLMPMTGAAFILFTLYMIPDPATTPLNWKRQIIFGLAVAAAYGLILVFHAVFGLFYALLSICFIRGCSLWVMNFVLSGGGLSRNRTWPAEPKVSA